MDKKIALFLYLGIAKQFKNQNVLILRMKSIVTVDIHFFWVEIVTFISEIIAIKAQIVLLELPILHISNN